MITFVSALVVTLGFMLLVDRYEEPMRRFSLWLGPAFLLAGTCVGLFLAPPERHMGEVQRIMYVHVPAAKIAMMFYLLAFVLAIASLWTSKARWDDRMVAAVEVGVVLNGLLLVQGSIWGRATWGVWWDWDVRLTTSLVMFLLFVGVLALRRMATSQDRKAQWGAVATIVAFIDVPLVYFCVRWWRSLHQVQSSPDTVNPMMVLPLRLNLAGFLLLGLAGLLWRARIERGRRLGDESPLPERMQMEESANA